MYRGRVNPGGQEKGVDVNLALDVVQLTHENRYDCGIIVSQDWDFGSAVALAKVIADNQSRVIEFDSAFPYDNNNTSRRGIPGTIGFISIRRCTILATTRRTIGLDKPLIPNAQT